VVPEAAPVVVRADAGVPPAGPPPPFDLAGRSEGDALRELGATAPWQAVVERDRYLGRRGQEGLIFGTVIAGDADAPTLVDESEGQGLLAVELDVPETVILTTGERLLAWGSWWPRDGRWRWRASRVARLPGRGEVDDRPRGLEPDPPVERPADAKVASAASSGDTVAFVVRDIPLDAKDGWAVSDPDSEIIVARVVLPGERGSYGGQDLRAANESWHLRRGQLYVGTARRVFRPKISLTLPVIYIEGRPAPAH